MQRFPLAAPLLALCLALPAPALAQKADKKDAPDDVQAAIQRAVDKAKAEIRDEVRAELQGQQSAREFLDAGNAADKPRLELLQLDGYLRVRGDLLNDLSLRRHNDHSLGPAAAAPADRGGYYLFPPPLHDPLGQSTQTSGNLRLRLEPVINVSEQVRILAQIDLLDGIVLGSGRSAQSAKDQPWYASSVQPPLAGSHGIDRDSLTVKRVWGEVQTPVGLLSFGRMPSQWGMGIVANAGSGLDDDLGDSVDRLQLAIPLRQTMVGPLVLVPYYDITGSGLVSQNLGGTGQPFSVDKADESWTMGLKAVRIDTEEEMARKLARGESSLNYGGLYGYSVQHYSNFTRTGTPGDGASTTAVDTINTGYAAHRLSLWGRYRTKRLRLEAEVAGVYGSIADPRTSAATASPGAVDIRSFGGAFQTDYRPSDGKWLLGLDLGFASGDRAPGLGNRPERGTALPGAIDGAQFGNNDLAIRNFRFNAAYRVDQILWRELLGNVTDAWYLKPSVRWDVLEGLSLQLAIVYSQAIFRTSTPSGRALPLGLESDFTIRYASDDGFHAWFTWAMLEPLAGLGYPVDYGVVDLPGLKRAHALRTGLAIKF
ncbi:MAG: TIGR04551 family protein [Deltaproteobacteria bacterium]|nr:TIGR04551 family protein [Deltaproteobacteria bacterium]